MIRYRLASLTLALLVALPLLADAQTARPPSPLRRWIEVQALTFSTRYRVIENNRGVVTSNQLQYKTVVRGRFDIDADHRYTINAGFFTGTSFTGSWDNWGAGTGSFVGQHYLKQLFADAVPVKGLELQYGGLYFENGLATEVTAYDLDAFMVGERVSVRKPSALYLDDVTVTRSRVDVTESPDVIDRFDGLAHANYTQVLVQKRFAPALAASAEYETRGGSDTLRAAVLVTLPEPSPIEQVRYEQYRRTTNHPASGFAVEAGRRFDDRVRLQVGYTSIDELDGPINGDRYVRGRRVFAVADVPVTGPVTVQFFATQALDAPYTISNRTRFDAVITYNVLTTLRKAGVF